jgi:hypothetical protein
MLCRLGRGRYSRSLGLDTPVRTCPHALESEPFVEIPPLYHPGNRCVPAAPALLRRNDFSVELSSH